MCIAFLKGWGLRPQELSSTWWFQEAECGVGSISGVMCPALLPQL